MSQLLRNFPVRRTAAGVEWSASQAHELPIAAYEDVAERLRDEWFVHAFHDDGRRRVVHGLTCSAGAHRRTMGDRCLDCGSRWPL